MAITPKDVALLQALADDAEARHDQSGELSDFLRQQELEDMVYRLSTVADRHVRVRLGLKKIVHLLRAVYDANLDGIPSAVDEAEALAEELLELVEGR